MKRIFNAYFAGNSQVDVIALVHNRCAMNFTFKFKLWFFLGNSPVPPITNILDIFPIILCTY